MKKIGIASAITALLLFCAILAGTLIVSAGAEELNATVYFTVGDLSMEGAEHFDGIIPAFTAARNRQWEATDVLEIRFKGEISAGQQN